MTDNFTWLQCFGANVSVRAPPAPHLIPELMAYIATIVRVRQDYSGLAWVRYDAAFRRQAALTRNDRWSVINSTLYTMCFTGLESSTKRCELCFASTHTERECAQRRDPDPGMGDCLKAIETAVVAVTHKQEQTSLSVQPGPKPSGEPCRKWNSSGCTYPRCRHTHAGSSCGGSHPATKCPLHPSHSNQGSRSQPYHPVGKHFLPPYPTLLEGHHVLYDSSNKVTLLNMVVTCYCYGVLGLSVQMLLYDYMKSFMDKNMPRMVYSWERRRVVFSRFRSRPPRKS